MDRVQTLSFFRVWACVVGRGVGNCGPFFCDGAGDRELCPVFDQLKWKDLCDYQK